MTNYESLKPTNADIESEFTPQRRRELYDRVLNQATAPKGGRGGWYIAAAVAAGAVTVASFAIPAMLRSDPVPAEPTLQTSSHEAISVTPSPAPMTLGLVSYGSGTPVAAEVLDQVAAKASQTEIAGLQPGAYLKLVSISLNSETQELVSRESYVDAEGWTWVHETTDTGRSDWWLFGTLTSAWVADLPTDPNQLEVKLRALEGSNSEDESVYKAVDEILRSEVASPQLRSAALQVLRNVASSPQPPALNKEGLLATPVVEVLEVALPDDTTGYRVNFSDPGTRAGVSYSMVLDGSGRILESATDYDGSDPAFPTPTSYHYQVQQRESVAQLPAEFVAQLGTEHVEQN